MTTPSNVDGNAVLVAKILVTGGSYVCAVGAAPLPVNAEDPLHAAFQTLGYIGPDGVTRSDGKTLKNVMASGGTIVKTHATEQTMTHTLRIMQSNRAALETVFGPDNVTDTPSGGYRVAHNIKQNPRRMFAFDLSEGDSYVREVIPNGQVTAVGDVSLGGENELAYDVTITCYDDALGNKAYTFYKLVGAPAAPVTPPPAEPAPAEPAPADAIPTVTAITPTSPVTSDAVTLTGTGFASLVSLYLDGILVPDAMPTQSGTGITFTMPSGVAGECQITVTNSAGTSAPFIFTRG